MRQARKGNLWVSLLVAFLGAAVFATFLPQQAAADEGKQSDSVQISNLIPEQYRLGDNLRVSAEVDLPTGSSWLVETFLLPTQFDSMWEMDSFVLGEGFPGWRLSSEERTVPTNSELSWIIPADQMPWPDASTAGARGLAVRFSNDAGVVHEARTVLIYEPLEQYPRTKINVVLMEDGSLDPRELRTLAKRDGITIAAPTPATASDTDTPNRSPLHVALDHPGVEILSVPTSGSDASALAGSKLKLLLELSLNSRANAADSEYKEAAVITDAILASDSGFTQNALANLPGNVIVSPRNWGDDTRWENSITPTSLVETEVRGTPMTIIDNWAPAADLFNAEVGTDAQELLLRQRLRMLTLHVGLQDPEDQRSLLVRHARGLKLDETQLTERLDALLGPDWVEPTSFSEITSSGRSQISRPALPEKSSKTADYSKRLRPLEKEYKQAQTVVGATTAGLSLLDPFTETILAATPSYLKDSTQTERVRMAIAELKEVTESITVLPLSTVNMVHQDANFPLSVANHGQADANVVVTLESSDARLQAVESVDVFVEAGGQVEVLVPVRAVGAGDINVKVVLRSPSGGIIDNAQSVEVRVRPNWEDIGTIVVSAGALALFGFGLLRSFRSAKRRSKS